LTDGNPPLNPSLYGASEHRASPGCEHSAMGGGDDSSGKGAWCPNTFGKDAIYVHRSFLQAVFKVSATRLVGPSVSI
jgi:hypothetical protein